MKKITAETIIKNDVNFINERIKRTIDSYDLDKEEVYRLIKYICRLKYRKVKVSDIRGMYTITSKDPRNFIIKKSMNIRKEIQNICNRIKNLMK